jgi:hypothetical protein
VRFGYPRIQGEKLASMKKSIETMDDDQVCDLSEYSPNDIHECLLFLESLFSPTWDAASIKKQRALIVAIAFRTRILKLQAATEVVESKDSCWDGHADMKKHKTVDRAIKMVEVLCNSLGGENVIQRAVLSYKFLEKFIAIFIFNGNAEAIKKLPSNVLYRRIVSI